MDMAKKCLCQSCREHSLGPWFGHVVADRIAVFNWRRQQSLDLLVLGARFVCRLDVFNALCVGAEHAHHRHLFADLLLPFAHRQPTLVAPKSATAFHRHVADFRPDFHLNLRVGDLVDAQPERARSLAALGLSQPNAR